MPKIVQIAFFAATSAILAGVLQGCALPQQAPPPPQALRASNPGILENPETEIKRLESIFNIQSDVERMRTINSESKIACEACIKDSWSSCASPKMAAIPEINKMILDKTGKDVTQLSLQGDEHQELYFHVRAELTMKTWLMVMHQVWQPCAKQISECKSQCIGPERQAVNVEFKACELCAVFEEKIHCPFETQMMTADVNAYVAEAGWTQGNTLEDIKLNEWMELQHRLLTPPTADGGRLVNAASALAEAAQRTCTPKFFGDQCAVMDLCPAEQMDAFRAFQQAKTKDDLLDSRHKVLEARGEHDPDDHNDPGDELSHRIAAREVQAKAVPIPPDAPVIDDASRHLLVSANPTGSLSTPLPGVQAGDLAEAMPPGGSVSVAVNSNQDGTKTAVTGASSVDVNDRGITVDRSMIEKGAMTESDAGPELVVYEVNGIGFVVDSSIAEKASLADPDAEQEAQASYLQVRNHRTHSKSTDSRKPGGAQASR